MFFKDLAVFLDLNGTLVLPLKQGSLDEMTLIPGADDTLRVNGRATLSTDPELLERFEVRGAKPKLVILVAVEQVYLHCAKALIRSQLWAPESQIDRKSMPSFARMIREQLSQEPDEAAIAAAEEDYDARNQRTLY